MAQNEQEYLESLRSALAGTIPEKELEDILSDYAEHFRSGREAGRTEEALYRALGEPGDVAKEIRAMYMVSRAEESRSFRNILRAIVATVGLGLFNLVVVLVPFIILVVLLGVILIAGAAGTAFGPVAFVLALLQIAGISPVNFWLWPLAGVFFSVTITSLGLLFIIGDYYLARFFYRLGIRYLRWNVRVIRGTGATG